MVSYLDSFEAYPVDIRYFIECPPFGFDIFLMIRLRLQVWGKTTMEENGPSHLTQGSLRSTRLLPGDGSLDDLDS